EDFDENDPAKKKAIRKGLKLMAREIQLGVAAAQKALGVAAFGDFHPANRVGVSFSSDYIVTTPQELIAGVAACRDLSGVFEDSRWSADGLTKMTPLWQLKFLTNMAASHITIYNAFYGPAHDITNREASFGAALGEAVEKIRAGRADAMVVGATGSRIHPSRLVSAIKEGELSSRIVKGAGASGEFDVCRPFDAARRGAIPGEGAGAIIIEDAESAKKRGAKIYAEVVGGAYRGVVRHAGKISGKVVSRDLVCSREDAREAIRLTLSSLFNKCGVSPKDVGFVNANARGDVLLDAAEAAALRDVFGDSIDSVPTTSLKGHIGNPGAGAGAIETVAGILALQENALFPTLNYETPDPACNLNVAREYGAPTGDSFVKICAQSIGQASAVYIRRWV
ncbi:MAG: beta-ketoacyl-[acyl-carrier-protein] synthase family protein, partial [Thermoguttaceae bacterium]|nr:beta-ketoacyl-[acyl-carrier-protein] synthase family protein [Thermoguttaceae bacterium]